MMNYFGMNFHSLSNPSLRGKIQDRWCTTADAHCERANARELMHQVCPLLILMNTSQCRMKQRAGREEEESSPTKKEQDDH
jgi:hypothetical protein